MKTIEDLQKATDADRTTLFGSIRRMAVTLTRKALWQLAGFKYDGEQEVVNAEPFTGIGIAARPPASGKPEAILIGDAKNLVIVAVRDEKTRAAIAGAIKAGETMLFTPLSVVYMKDDGTIEARSAGGVAQSLATKADLDALRVYVARQFGPVGHTHGVSGGVTNATTPSVLPAVDPDAPVATGTTKLKGE